MKRHTLTRRGLWLGLLALPLPVASAATDTILDMTTSVLDHPPGAVSGAAKAVALGRFSDDAIPDAAVLHGEQVWFLYAPDRRNVWSLVDEVYSSIAALPVYTDNGQDVVLASGREGLYVLAWDPSVRTLVPALLDESSDWADATALHVAAESDGTYVIGGLHAVDDRLLIARWDPIAGLLSFEGALDVAPGTSAVAALQWTSTGPLAFATASTAGVEILDVFNNKLHTVSQAGAEPILLPITDEGVPHRLAWMSSPSTLVEALYVVRANGVLEPAQVYVNADVEHMALMDVGDDDRKELWLTCGQATFGIALSRGSTTTFQPWPANPAFLCDLDRANSALKPAPVYDNAPGSGVFGSPGTPPVPAVLDLDGDGDDDLFLAGHPGQADRAMVLLGDVFDEEAPLGADDQVKPWQELYTFQVSHGLNGYRSALLAFDYPDMPTAGPASNATHVRYVAWTEPTSGGPLTLVAATTVPLGQPIPPSTVIGFSNLQTFGSSLNVHIELSYLKLGAGGVMTRAFPAYNEIIPVDLSDTSLHVFTDLAVLNDGGSTSGSTQRPPISPPGGGTTP